MSYMEKAARRVFLRHSQAGYSQFGEDLIINHLFSVAGIARPTYLDIGANHPKFISNTYYFYQRGSRGVLVEPNPRLSKKLRASRPHDVVVEAGIGFVANSAAEFYVFPEHADGLSTFSKAEATHWETVGMKGHGTIAVEYIIKIPLIPINDVIVEHLGGNAPHLLSLDIEGYDYKVLASLDFARFAPDVICVETLAYNSEQQSYKREDIIGLALSRGYVVYADTRVNTIFCKRKFVSF